MARGKKHTPEQIVTLLQQIQLPAARAFQLNPHAVRFSFAIH